MKVERTIVVLLVLHVGSTIEQSVASAQDPSQPPQSGSVIPLERVGGTPGAIGSAPQAPTPAPSMQANRYAILPSPQAHVSRSNGGNSAIARLRNPFDWEGHRPTRGLSGLSSPQYPPKTSGTLPGVIPGPQEPGVEWIPGAGPGAQAPGMEGAGRGWVEAPGAAPGPVSAGERRGLLQPRRGWSIRRSSQCGRSRVRRRSGGHFVSFPHDR